MTYYKSEQMTDRQELRRVVAVEWILAVMEMFYILIILSVSWLWYYNIILQGFTIGENWVKNTGILLSYFLHFLMYLKLSQNKVFN